VDPVSSLSARQQDTERQQAQNARVEVEKNKAVTIKQKKQDADERAALKGEIKREISNSFEPEGESVDERTRYAKETGKDPQTGKPSVKGGNPPPAAMRGLEKELRSTGGLMSSRRKPIQPQGKKKVPGKKPPAAGEFGAPRSPAQKLAAKRAAAKRSQDSMSSRFD
jgi:hypothetical protein